MLLSIKSTNIIATFIWKFYNPKKFETWHFFGSSPQIQFVARLYFFVVFIFCRLSPCLVYLPHAFIRNIILKYRYMSGIKTLISSLGLFFSLVFDSTLRFKLFILFRALLKATKEWKKQLNYSIIFVWRKTCTVVNLLN